MLFRARLTSQLRWRVSAAKCPSQAREPPPPLLGRTQCQPAVRPETDNLLAIVSDSATFTHGTPLAALAGDFKVLRALLAKAVPANTLHGTASLAMSFGRASGRARGVPPTTALQDSLLAVQGAGTLVFRNMPPPSAILVGQSGTGKTFALRLVAEARQTVLLCHRAAFMAFQQGGLPASPASTTDPLSMTRPDDGTASPRSCSTASTVLRAGPTLAAPEQHPQVGGVQSPASRDVSVLLARFRTDIPEGDRQSQLQGLGATCAEWTAPTFTLPRFPRRIDCPAGLRAGPGLLGLQGACLFCVDRGSHDAETLSLIRARRNGSTDTAAAIVLLQGRHGKHSPAPVLVALGESAFIQGRAGGTGSSPLAAVVAGKSLALIPRHPPIARQGFNPQGEQHWCKIVHALCALVYATGAARIGTSTRPAVLYELQLEPAFLEAATQALNAELDTLHKSIPRRTDFEIPRQEFIHAQLQAHLMSVCLLEWVLTSAIAAPQAFRELVSGLSEAKEDDILRCLSGLVFAGPTRICTTAGEGPWQALQLPGSCVSERAQEELIAFAVGQTISTQWAMACTSKGATQFSFPTEFLLDKPICTEPGRAVAVSHCAGEVSSPAAKPPAAVSHEPLQPVQCLAIGLQSLLKAQVPHVFTLAALAGRSASDSNGPEVDKMLRAVKDGWGRETAQCWLRSVCMVRVMCGCRGSQLEGVLKVAEAMGVLARYQQFWVALPADLWPQLAKDLLKPSSVRIVPEFPFPDCGNETAWLISHAYAAGCQLARGRVDAQPAASSSSHSPSRFRARPEAGHLRTQAQAWGLDALTFATLKCLQEFELGADSRLARALGLATPNVTLDDAWTLSVSTDCTPPSTSQMSGARRGRGTKRRRPARERARGGCKAARQGASQGCRGGSVIIDLTFDSDEGITCDEDGLSVGSRM